LKKAPDKNPGFFSWIIIQTRSNVFLAFHIKYVNIKIDKKQHEMEWNVVVPLQIFIWGIMSVLFFAGHNTNIPYFPLLNMG